MKQSHASLAGVVVSLGLWAFGGMAAAEAPPLPSSRYGAVSLAGAPAPDGTVVSARFAGLEVAATVVDASSGTARYRLDVPGDRAETPEIEGPAEGEPFELRVGGALAATETWQSGLYTAADLATGGGADLAVAIDDGVTSIAAGGSLGAAVSVANQSSMAATGVDLVVDLPTGAALVSASDGGALDAQGRLRWPQFAISGGDGATRSFVAQLPSAYPAGIEIVETRVAVRHDGAEGGDPDPSDDSAGDVDALEAAPDLVTSVSDGASSVAPGSTLFYRTTVANSGTQGATGVELEVALPSGAELFSTSHGGHESGGVVRWPAVSLPASATFERVMTLRLPEELDPGVGSLTVLAHAADDGTNGDDLEPADNDAIDVDGVTHAPDLVAREVSRFGTTTDPTTLEISGEVLVTMTNSGTLASGPFTTVVFLDVNGDGSYDPLVDSALGTAGHLSLVPQESNSVLVPVAGTVPFLGDRLFAFLDSDHEVSELSETNNVANSSTSCGAVPPPESFAPRVELSWPPAGGPTNFPRAIDSLSTPLVVQLTDDNGDGLWNELDIPDLVFVTADLTYLLEPQVALRAIRGGSGTPIFDVNGFFPHPTNPQLLSFSGLAAGDIDNDGKPEILSTTFGPAPFNQIRAYEHNGVPKWVSAAYRTHPSPTGLSNRDNPTIADLDGDGFAEIVVGANVFDRFGHLLWRGTGGQAFQSSGNSGDRGGAISVAADVDLDGRMEVVTGNTLYRWNGEIVWQVPWPDGFPAVANFDDDPQAEIVVVSQGTVRLHDTDGTLIWGPVTLPGSDPEAGGPPTIGDFDGDGAPEIGVAGSDVYVALDTDGSILWQAQTQDYSSNLTGSTTFDFDGDGWLEIIYRDERRLRIYRGYDGEVLFESVLSSNTQTEEPVVADVDRDGNAEIVVTSDRAPDVPVAPGERTYGLRVFGDAGDGWVAARPIWNQHAYTPELVDTDAGTPAVPAWSWLEHNSFRANVPPGGDPTAAPDLTASRLLVDLSALPQVSASVRIGNGGRTPVGPGLPVAFFDGDPQSGGALITTREVPQPLLPGGYADVSVSFPLVAVSSGLLVVVADHDGVSGRELECDEANNVASASLDLTSLGLWITLDDATTAVGAGDEVEVILAVHNAFAGAASGIAVEDTLPEHTQFVSASDGGAVSSGAVSWPAFGLGSGETKILRLTYEVDPAIPIGVTSLTNQATVTDDGSQGPDPSPGNNVATDVNAVTTVTANAGGPYLAAEGTTVLLDGTASFDRDGTIVSYLWDLDGDGEYDDASGPTVLWYAADEGAFTVRLQVTDDAGEIDVDAASVVISNVAPSIEAPAAIPGEEGAALTLASVVVGDPGLEDGLVATVAWGDGAEESFPVARGSLARDHTYLEDGTYAIELCVADGDGGETCAAIAAQVANVAPRIPVAVGYDVLGWSHEELGAGGTTSWNVAGDGLYATELRNGEPTVLVGDLPSLGEIAFDVRTTDGDDDYFGVAVGFHPGDLANHSADYLLVDWKGGDQSGAHRGLALSRVRGVPIPSELWAHFDAASNGSENSVTELARGLTRGHQGWLRNTAYRFRLEVGSSRLRVWVDDVLELDWAGSIPAGGLAFYDYSQAATTFATASSALALGGSEGDSLALRARFFDQGIEDTHTARVAWGDGSEESVPVAEEPGVGEVQATHVYPDEGDLTAEICVADDEGDEGCAEVPVRLENVAPTLTWILTTTGFREDPVSLAGTTFTDPGILDLHSATVDWGDGTVEPATVIESNGSGSVEGAHAYSSAGTYALSLCLDDGDGGVTCGNRTLELVDRFLDLAVTKTVSPGEARPGQRVTYALTVTNPGTLAATGVTLTDLLPQHLGFVSASGGGTHASGVTTWAIGTLAPGGSAVVTLQADVAASAPFGATVWNHASVADDGASGADGNPGDNEAAVPLRLSDSVTPIVTIASPLAGTEGLALALTGVTFADTAPSQRHTATIDWGDGTTGAGTVTPASGLTGTIGGSHVYADDGIYPLEVCVTDLGSHTGCTSAAITIENSTPVLLDPGPVDLHHWRAEEYASTEAHADWQVAADGLSVHQVINSTPSVFVSPIPAFGVPLEGIMKVGWDGNWDNDYIGFALGIHRGDTLNPDAEWLLVDWKQGDQTGALAGLAVSRVWGIPMTGEFWVHTDSPDNGPESGVQELARAATLSRIGWTENRDYRFRFDYGPTHLRIWVNDVLQFDLVGAFPEGGFAFYNYSQQDVLYRGFTVGAEDRFEGETFELIAPFTDLGPIDTFTGDVVWDDGATTSVVPEATGGFGAIRETHVYPDDGDYAIGVCVSDDDSATDCGSFPLLVYNLPPVVEASAELIASAGIDQAFPLATFTDPGRLDIHTATVSWGDGETGPGDVSEDDGSGSVAAVHAYAETGVYGVEICVADDDGGVGCDTTAVTVGAELPALVATKVVTPIDLDGDGQVTPGDQLVYRVEIANVGITPATGIRLTDPVPAHTGIVAGSVTPELYAVGEDPVTVEIPTLAPGDSMVVQFVVSIDTPLPTGVREIVNSGTVEANEVSPLLTDDPSLPGPADPTRIPVVVSSVLGLVKTAELVDLDGDGVATPGDEILWHVEAATGGDVAATGVLLRDSIPENSTLVPGSVVVSQGTVVALDPLTVAIGDLAVGSLVTLEMRTTIDPALPPEVTEIANQASVGSTEIDLLLSDDPATPIPADPTVVPVYRYPVLSVAPATVVEGDAGVTPLLFTVSLDRAVTESVSVTWSLADGTATAGEDYAPASGVVSIPAGATEATVSVDVLGDQVVEADETFSVTLAEPVLATLGVATATGTIVNDDATELFAADVAVEEGEPAIVSVVLTFPSALPVSVAWTTADGTAVAGEDYVPASGIVEFAPLQTSLTLVVETIEEEVQEEDETLSVLFSAPLGAGLPDPEAIVTILDDDTPDCALTCPERLVVANDPALCGASVVLPDPSSVGECGEVFCAPASGEFFPVGVTTVVCTAGAVAVSCTYEVEVQDLEPPEVEAPELAVGNDAGLCSAVVSFEATASDNCPGLSALTCAPSSGTSFPVGTTPVSCSVADAAGNSAFDSGRVEVSDLEAPILDSCPDDVTLELPPGTESWRVEFALPPGSDNCPGLLIDCVPASGSDFPIGSTEVLCTAIDGAGLQASCDFVVDLSALSVLEIPTLSGRSLALFALMLGAGGGLLIRRRRGSASMRGNR